MSYKELLCTGGDGDGVCYCVYGGVGGVHEALMSCPIVSYTALKLFEHFTFKYNTHNTSATCTNILRFCRKFELSFCINISHLNQRYFFFNLGQNT